jgi:SAM-dependent methyltransferase
LDSNRHGQRGASFDGVAELYARGRPAYPGELIEDLLRLTGVGCGSRVLEIGPGTGQLSVALASHGASLLAVELGSNLAAVARRNLAPFADAEVVVANFDEWTGTSASFDAVIAATSFHWLDPSNRVVKCASLLRPGGSLAVVETRWGVAVGEDAFYAASQTCYARWTPNHDSASRQVRPEDAIPVDLSAADPEVALVAQRRYIVARTYTSSEYADLLSTFSDVVVLEPVTRERFLECVVRLIESRFGGRVTRQDLYDLSVAQRT